MKTPTLTLLLALTAATAAAEDLRLEQRTLRDPGMHDVESHTLLVPEGWTLEGGVTWTPEITSAYVHVDATVTAPDGRQVGFHPSGSYTWVESNMNVPRPRPGQWTGGKLFADPGRGPEDYVLHDVLPEHRPEARLARVVDVSAVEEVERSWREMMAPNLEQERNLNRMNQSMGLDGGTTTTIRVPVVRVRYREDGCWWEEDFSLLYMAMESSFQDGWGGWYRGTDWMVYSVRSLRAPKGELDEATPLLRTVAGSLRTTRRWQAMIDELNAQLLKIRQRAHRVTMREVQKRSQILYETSDEIMEMRQEGWKRTQASNDRIAKAWSNTMHGVDDYELPDGTVRTLDSGYDHVFTDKSGGFLFTNDALLDPNVGSTTEWTRIDPITPTGDAANR